MWSRTFGTSPRTPPGGGTVESMAPTAYAPVADRVVERRRAVALARHYREAEGLSIGQIADRLGRSPATIKAYFYDPTGEKARAVKARYQGLCRGCGAYTQPRNGKGDAYAYCKACHPGAIERRWTRERLLDAMLRWRTRYGRLPSSYDWSRTRARRRGGEPLERLSTGDWPSAGVVTAVYGSWKAARAAAARQIVEAGGDDRRSRDGVVTDDARPAGREVIANRRPNAHDRAASGRADRDSRPETLYLEGSPFQRRLKRSAVS
jgi:AraC-like DNA-binding protein